VVLVDGDDPILVGEAVGAVVAELLGDADRTLSVESHGGEDVDLAMVADSCATPPMLSDRRIVVLRDVGRWSADEVAPLLAYLDDPLPTTRLVLVGGGGQTAAKLSAAAKAKGRVVQTRVESRQADQWLKGRVEGSGVRLDRSASALVKEHLGEDHGRVVPLLQILEAAYGSGTSLSEEDVKPYLGQAGAVTPWTLTDAIDSGDAPAALTALHRLLEAGDRHPLVVLAVLHRHVQSILKVDSPSIRTDSQAAEALGIAEGRSTFPAKKARSAARRWGSGNVAEAIGLLADAEVDLKGASGLPPETVLEVLVARLCRLAGRPAGRRG
jgi:DNA polymerase-3 subunit delta